MEFKFRRKYTNFFIFALVIHIVILAFWLLSPIEMFTNEEAKKTICLLILINTELVLVFYLGLFRKKYYAYHDKLIVKRSFFTNIVISYKDITRIRERLTDTILLGFGHCPSFTIYYQNPKRKKYTIRSDNSELLLKIIKNEIDIANLNKKQ